MDRLIATGSVPQAQADTAPTTGTPQYATDGNPVTNTPATQWPAYQYNALQEELIALIEAGGVTPDKANNGQVLASILAMFRDGKANYAPDTGTANAIVVALSPAPTALSDGQVIWIKVANSNTGPTTITPNGIAAYPAHAAGAAMAGGELAAGGYYGFGFDAANNVLNLVASGAGALAVGAATQPSHALQKNQGIGQTQAWTGVTGSRALSTTYTNTTGRPISVLVSASVPSSGDVSAVVNGSVIAHAGGGSATSTEGTLSFIVPPGATYGTAVTGAVALTSWFELR